MSREAGRVRALLHAARLQFLLETGDRVELLGYALAPEARWTSEHVPARAAAPSAPRGQDPGPRDSIDS